MTMLGIGGAGIFTIYNLIVAMGQRVYGKPGYLLFAIPAKTQDIIAAKIITHFIWLMVTGIVFSLGIFTIFYSMDAMFLFQEIWNEIAYLDIWTFWSISGIFLTIIVYMLYFLSFFMFLFAFLNLIYKGPHKILMGIVFYVIIDSVISIFTGIPMEAILIGTMLNEEATLSINFVWIVFSIYTVVSAALLGATYHIMNRKMELQ
jgi:hypothetical protein